jgi:hypothetical protein
MNASRMILQYLNGSSFIFVSYLMTLSWTNYLISGGMLTGYELEKDFEAVVAESRDSQSE